MALCGAPPTFSVEFVRAPVAALATGVPSSAFSRNPKETVRPVQFSGMRVPLAIRRGEPSSMSVAASARLADFGFLKGGTGLLERPAFDQSQFDPFPQLQEGGDIGSIADRKGLGSSDSYRVLLVDDLRHTERLVEKALPEVVPSISAFQARDLFHESRQNGVAVVIVTVKEHAEFYSQMMVRKGLRSAIEPDTSI